MQNLPITTTTQPATPAQTPSQADNNAAQAAESFGNVLARQRANSGESNADTLNKGQAASSAPPSSSTDSASAATVNELEAPIPDGISILPGDMLAALLPAPANTNSVAANEKPVSQAPAPDGISTLPSDMLAALLSAPANANSVAASEKLVSNEKPVSQAPTPDGISTLPSDVLAALLPTPTTVRQDASTATRQQPAVADVQGGARQQLIAVGAQGGARQFASAAQSIGEQTAASLSRALSNPTPTVAVTDTAQGKTFSTVLETLGKDAASTVLSVGTTQTSALAALPDATTLASLTQSTASPIATSQNGPVQVAVNTPVSHDAWGDEFNQKVTWIATQHEQTAELHLNPPHLGPLDVVLNISGDQATALFTSPHAAVREAVEQALPKLREMLADNGIMLGNAMVNDQSPKEQQAWQADKQRGENASLPGKAGDTVPMAGTAWPARRHQGMVDTFV